MIAHTAKTHGRFTQTLHWITAILVLLAFASGLGGSEGLVVGAHTLLGDALIWLAGLHAVAAIFHYLVLRDDVLASMTPAWVHLPKWPDN